MCTFPFVLQWCYPVFVVWVGVTALLVFCLVRRTRSEQFWMSIGGAVGGPCIAYLFRDFFNPQSAYWWHAGFGGFFLGMLVTCSLASTKSVLIPERSPTVTRSDKVNLTLVAAFLGFLLWFITNAVLATAIAFAAAAFGIAMRRKDLKELVIAGAFTALLLYGGLIGAFLSLLPDVDEAGRVLSPYYNNEGPWWTALMLFIWVPSFGAYFGAGHAFYRNKKPISY